MKQQTILETHSFTKDAESLLSAQELDDLKALLSVAPTSGDVIPGTGGLRKLRIPAEKKGKGKRSGARVIYYFHNDTIPLALIALYAKNEKLDLDAKEKRQMKTLIEEFVSAFKKVAG